MRSFVELLLVGSAVIALDVVPHCGGPEVVIRNPGQDCGARGPRWRGDCRAPSQCIDIHGKGRRCSLRCSTDSDCAALGRGFTCSERGDSEGHSQGSFNVCAEPTLPSP